MFAFFVDNKFQGFWCNLIGDIFCDLTIEKMGWNKSSVDLVYYSNMSKIPSMFSFREDKLMNIKEKSLIIEQQPLFAEDGSPLLNEEGKEIFGDITTEIFKTIQTIEPVFYLAKGIMIKPC